MMPTTFEPEFKALPRTSATVLTFSAHLHAPEVEVDDDSARSMVCLSSVLDKSGSMQGSKLSLVKRTSEFMMQHLSASDKLGVVAYDSDVTEIVPLSRTSEALKHEAGVMVKRVCSGSCTNLSGGLFLGIKQQQDNTYLDWGDAVAEAPAASDAPAAAGAASGGAASESPRSSTAMSSHLSASNMSTESFEMVQAVDNVEEAEEDNEDEDEEQQMQVNMLNVMPVQNVAAGFDPLMEEDEDDVVQQQAFAPQQQQQQQAFAPPPQQQQQQAVAPLQQQQQQQQSGWYPRNVMSRMGQMMRGGISTRRTPAGRQCTTAKPPARIFGGRAPPAGKAVDPNCVRSVFLFTDGLANEGVTEEKQLVAMTQKMLDKTPRVRVFTFGFGADHSPSMLSALAQAGGGTYYYIENEEKIPEAFADALGGLLSVSLQNATVEFVPGEGVTVSDLHTNFPTESTAGGGRVINVGDLFSGESKDLLFDVEVPALAEATDRFLVGTLRVSYLDVRGAANRTDEVQCFIARPEEVPLAQAPSLNVALQRARVVVARTLLEAREEADTGHFEEARARIGESLKVLREVQMQAEGGGGGGGTGGWQKNLGRKGGGGGGDRSMAKNFVDDLEEALANMKDLGTYRSHGTKVMSSKGMGHYQQRSHGLEEACVWMNEDDDDEGENQNFSYVNKNQKSMRRKAKTFFSA